MLQDKKYTLESELASALSRLSSGKISEGTAAAIATAAIKNWDLSNKALAHKGINWYAKQLIGQM